MVLPPGKVPGSKGEWYLDFWRRASPEVPRNLAVRQPFFNDPGGDLCPRGKTQLPENIVHMPFGCSLAHHQQISNLLARFALGNELRDFAFTCR